MSLLRMHAKLGGNAHFESYQLKFSQETTIQRLILASGTLCLECCQNPPPGPDAK